MYKRNWNVQIDGKELRDEVTKLRKELGVTDKVLFMALWEIGTKHRDEIEARIAVHNDMKATVKANKAVNRLKSSRFTAFKAKEAKDAKANKAVNQLISEFTAFKAEDAKAHAAVDAPATSKRVRRLKVSKREIPEVDPEPHPRRGIVTAKNPVTEGN